MPTEHEGNVGKMRVDSIEAWLERTHAQLLGVGKGPNKSRLEFYAIGRRVVIIQHHKDNHGWDLFVTPSDSNRIDETLAAADKVIGLPHRPIKACPTCYTDIWRDTDFVTQSGEMVCSQVCLNNYGNTSK